MSQELLESFNVLLLEISLEDLALKDGDLSIIQITIAISINDSEDSQQCFLEVRLELLSLRVLEWCYGEQNSPLSTEHDVNELLIVFGRTFDSHLDLL